MKISKQLLMPFNFPVFVGSIGFIAGSVVAYVTGLAVEFDFRIIFVLIICLVLAIINKKNLVIFNILLVLIFSCLAMLRSSYLFDLGSEKSVSNLVGTTGRFDAEVIYDSSISSDTKTIVKIEGYEGYVLLKVSRFHRFWSGEKMEFEGDIIEAENFDGFNYQEYLENHLVLGIVDNPDILSTEEPEAYFRIIKSIKSYFINGVNRSLPQPHASLLTGMTIGDINSMTLDFKDDLKATGTSHIVAVSGFNISLILSLFLNLSKFVHKRKLLIFSIILLSIYVLIVGVNNLSALRAYLMGMGLVLSQITGRKGGGFIFLALSAAIILFINPRNFLDIGFQLSFGATLGLYIFSKNIEQLLTKFLPNLIGQELSVVLAANILILPIMIKNFGELNIFSIVINLSFSILIPFVTLGGIFMTIILGAPDFIRFIFSFLIFEILNLVVTPIKIFSEIEFLKFSEIKIDELGLILIYLFEAVLFLFLKKKNEKVT